MRAYGVFVPRTATGNTSVRIIELANLRLSSLSGSATLSQTLGASDNGDWTFVAAAYCIDTGKLFPRYAYLKVGPVIDVNVQATNAPVISQAPQDASTIEGNNVTFSVTASGGGLSYRLSYQWQRSNDGGASYADVTGATSATRTLTATLADDASLWRVKVSNSTGQSTVSTPARLSVAQRVIVPSISSDPASQSVTEGQTASFTVVGSGTPVPTIQWQSRSAANADAEAGWSDIAAATNATHTTPAVSVAQSGRQYRAVLRNGGGSATSLPATLSVTAKVIAPAIVSNPQSQSVQAGQSGLFSVTASGSTPLSYQWFKNSVVITGANATEVLVPAEAADVGSSHQITVQVSNAAGSVTSAAAVLTVTAVPVVGTPVKAAEGGVLQTPSGEVSLVIPPGSLAADTTISLTTQVGLIAGLPADITPIGSIVKIGPSTLSFIKPATLTLPVPDTIPEGKVLAVIELAPTAAVNQLAAKSARAVTSAAPLHANLGRMAKAAATGAVSVMAAGDVANVLCADSQSVRGGSVFVDVVRASGWFTAAVPESACTGIITKPGKAAIPSDTTAPCRNSDYVDSNLGGGAATLSRHVSCQKNSTELKGVSDAKGTQYGDFRLDWRIGSDGPAKGLFQTYRISLKLTALTAGVGAAPLVLDVLPRFDCSPQNYPGTCTADLNTPRQLSSASLGYTEILVKVSFDWSAGDNTWNDFILGNVHLDFALPGETVQGVALGQPPGIRCDKGMAVNRGNGCVYAQAPAVFVLSASDGAVREAAEHIRDAQRNFAPGGLDLGPDGLYASSSNALQRTRVTGLGGIRTNTVSAPGANRQYSCNYADSLIKQRPQSSATCPATGGPACQCDEYPFNSTWNGSWSARPISASTTSASARYINGGQNEQAGTRIQRFYQAERVLDYTMDPGIVYNIGNEASSIPFRLGGDNFWVHIQ